MKIIIFDFEVFKQNVLLGSLIIDEKGEESFYQTWNKDDIKEMYFKYSDAMWIGHNNLVYDNLILEAIIKGEDCYELSKSIIEGNTYRKCKLPLLSYDLMNNTYFSLKVSELSCGKNIHTSEVDFNLNRQLTEEEKHLTEEYNKDDVMQTKHNFDMFQDSFKLRLEIIKEFNLSTKCLNLTEAQIAAKVLKAKRIEGIDLKTIKPTLYETLRLENEAIKEFYLSEAFRKGEKLDIKIGNAELSLGVGGIHSAIRKCHYDKVMYIDVSGYYNLVMLNYDLLPRSISKEGRELYEFMYHEQLKLKKINPLKRNVYKTILLAVFGASMNQGSDFYDPQKGQLITITGQLFLCDLLEKLQDKVTIVQSNTDGIMVVPNNWNEENEIIQIIEEWEKRTGFNCKKEHLYNLWQRDVNNYMCLDENKKVIAKGEALSNYEITRESYASGKLFNFKEPIIIAKALINYFLFDKTPEQTVEENKNDLRLFQYSCRKNTYDYSQYETFDFKTGNVNRIRLQGIDRGFAYNSKTVIGTIIKYKVKNGKKTSARIANLPDNIFVYNQDILSEKVFNELKDKINWNYYIERIYERTTEFIELEESNNDSFSLF